MSGDKRSVATDALEVLGTIITDKEVGRDAIHLACLPVVAGDDILLPGDHIGILNGKASVHAPKKVGIVDPFIQGRVTKDEKFLLVIYPRTIESLRHVWSHPDVPDEATAVAPQLPDPSVMSDTAAEEELDRFAREYLDSGSDSLDILIDGMDNGYLIDGGNFEGRGRAEIPTRIWELFEVYMGRPARRADRQGEVYFSCSC